MTLTEKYNQWYWRIADGVCEPIIAEFQLEQRQNEKYIDVIYRTLPFLYFTARCMQKSVGFFGNIADFHARHYHACFQFCDIADMLADS